MAETVTATWLPRSTSFLTKVATWRMRSRSATDVPPNFITILAIDGSVCAPCVQAIHRRHMSEAQRRMLDFSSPVYGGGGCAATAAQTEGAPLHRFAVPLPRKRGGEGSRSCRT